MQFIPSSPPSPRICRLRAPPSQLTLQPSVVPAHPRSLRAAVTVRPPIPRVGRRREPQSQRQPSAVSARTPRRHNSSAVTASPPFLRVRLPSSRCPKLSLQGAVQVAGARVPAARCLPAPGDRPCALSLARPRPRPRQSGLQSLLRCPLARHCRRASTVFRALGAVFLFRMPCVAALFRAARPLSHFALLSLFACQAPPVLPPAFGAYAAVARPRASFWSAAPRPAMVQARRSATCVGRSACAFRKPASSPPGVFDVDDLDF